MNKIQDNSIAYDITFFTVRYAFRKFFKKITIKGVENIPNNSPVIFAPNHQSGLIDPLVVLFSQKDPIVFMARADIFKSKLFSKLLRFLKIMPVYRIRDGYETLSRNEEQFEQAKDVLLDNKKLCIMPEGNHGHQHKLRPLVKGIFRIAFSAEEQLQGASHVNIVPVSIDYDFYQHAGATVEVEFAAPILVKDYMDSYLINPTVTTNNIRNDLASSMSGMMHDIRSNSNYDLFYKLSCYATPFVKKNKDQSNFELRKSISKRLDDLEKSGFDGFKIYDDLCINIDRLPGYNTEKVDLLTYNPNAILHIINALLAIVSIPGLIMNTPALLVNKYICSIIEDKQMHNTYAFVSGLILMPFVYLLVSIVISVIAGYGLLKAVILLIIVASTGIIGEKLRQYLKLPFRFVLYSFGKKKIFFNLCKNDYKNLKDKFMSLIRNDRL